MSQLEYKRNKKKTVVQCNVKSSKGSFTVNLTTNHVI